jgi:hypothetical protein
MPHSLSKPYQIDGTPSKANVEFADAEWGFHLLNREQFDMIRGDA